MWTSKQDFVKDHARDVLRIYAARLADLQEARGEPTRLLKPKTRVWRPELTIQETNKTFGEPTTRARRIDNESLANLQDDFGETTTRGWRTYNESLPNLQQRLGEPTRQVCRTYNKS